MHFPGAWLLMWSLTIASQTEAAFQETIPLSSQAGHRASPAEAQPQVPTEAAADDARESILDRRDLVESVDERDHEVLDEIEHRCADRAPCRSAPDGHWVALEVAHLLVVEALRVAAVRQVDRDDRELRAACQTGQVDQGDDA